MEVTLSAESGENKELSERTESVIINLDDWTRLKSEKKNLV